MPVVLLVDDLPELTAIKPSDSPVAISEDVSSSNAQVEDAALDRVRDWLNNVDLNTDGHSSRLDEEGLATEAFVEEGCLRNDSPQRFSDDASSHVTEHEEEVSDIVEEVEGHIPPIVHGQAYDLSSDLSAAEASREEVDREIAKIAVPVHIRDYSSICDWVNALAYSAAYGCKDSEKKIVEMFDDLKTDRGRELSVTAQRSIKRAIVILDFDMECANGTIDASYMNYFLEAFFPLLGRLGPDDMDVYHIAGELPQLGFCDVAGATKIFRLHPARDAEAERTVKLEAARERENAARAALTEAKVNKLWHPFPYTNEEWETMTRYSTTSSCLDFDRKHEMKTLRRLVQEDREQARRREEQEDREDEERAREEQLRQRQQRLGRWGIDHVVYQIEG